MRVLPKIYTYMLKNLNLFSFGLSIASLQIFLISVKCVL